MYQPHPPAVLMTGLLTTAVVLAGGAGTPAAATDGASAGALSAVHSDKCLDVRGAQVADGSAVYQWSCDAGVDQQWQIEPTTTPGVATLVSVRSGKCLEAGTSPFADGGTVYLWTCNEGPRQQWRVESLPTPGVFTSVSVGSGMCLAVARSSRADGARIYQAPCNSSGSQQWRLAPRAG